MSKMHEFKELSREALKARAKALREELRVARFGIASHARKDVRTLRAKRKELAQILTALQTTHPSSA